MFLRGQKRPQDLLLRLISVENHLSSGEMRAVLFPLFQIKIFRLGALLSSNLHFIITQQLRINLR